MSATISLIRGNAEVIGQQEATPETLNDFALAPWSPMAFRHESAEDCWDPRKGETGCPHPGGRHRHGAHFTGTRLLTYDLDNDEKDRNGRTLRQVTFDEVEKLVRDKALAFDLHTTRNHLKAKTSGKTIKPAVERFRLVLFLSEPITDPEVYGHTWLVYRDSLGLPVDEQCKDLARFYYPRPTDSRASWSDGDWIPPVTPEPAEELDPKARAVSLSDYPLEERAKRAMAYAARCPPAVEGQGGNAVTVSTVRKVCHDFGIGAEDLDLALGVLEEWRLRCEPPWKGNEWRTKVASSLRGCKNPLGWQLAEGVVTTASGEKHPPLWKDQNGKVIWPEEAVLAVLVPGPSQ